MQTLAMSTLAGATIISVMIAAIANYDKEQAQEKLTKLQERVVKDELTLRRIGRDRECQGLLQRTETMIERG